MNKVRDAIADHVKILAVVAMFVMAAMWGTSYFVLKELVVDIQVPDLLATRFAIATLAMAILGFKFLKMPLATVKHGIILGVLYGIAQILQTDGLAHTSASVSGFLSGLFVVFTPTFQALLLRRMVRLRIWLSVALSIAGLGILTLTGPKMSFALGELLTIGAAVFYSLHILYIAKVTLTNNAISLSIVQGATITVICFFGALPEGIKLPVGIIPWTQLIYLALFCGGLAIILQIWSQAHVEPTRAAVVMSSEPIWAAAFAIAMGQEPLLLRTVFGGTVLVTAMILASIPVSTAKETHRGHRGVQRSLAQ